MNPHRTIGMKLHTWIAVPARGALAAIALVCAAAAAQGDVRVKDITSVEGVRVNQIMGLGLVTGLNGTGSKSPLTRQIALNLIERLGVRADPALRIALRNDSKERTDNLSVVMVSADLPAFARKGARIDVTVSTFDNAQSLQGGVLVFTPLAAVDGEIYAAAAGPLTTGGFSFEGQAAQVQKNHPTTARIPNGATVERETVTLLGEDGMVRLLLKNADFETARRIAEAVNKLAPGSALARDMSTIECLVPETHRADVSSYLALVGELRVQPDTPATVVINERTGTIVIGDNVRVSRVLVTHANLAIITTESPEVSQPAPFSQGETTVVPRTDLEVIEEKAPVTTIDETATVGDLARALNALGVTPRDMSAIFQNLKESGALQAELIFK